MSDLRASADQHPALRGEGDGLPEWADRCMQLLSEMVALCSYGRIRTLGPVLRMLYLAAIREMSETPEIAAEVVTSCCLDSHWMPHPAALREKYAERLGVGPDETPSETIARHKREEAESRRLFPGGRVGPTEAEYRQQLRSGELRPMPDEVRSRILALRARMDIDRPAAREYQREPVRHQPTRTSDTETIERRRHE